MGGTLQDGVAPKVGTTLDDGSLVTEGYVCPEQGEKFELTPVVLPPLTRTSVQLDMAMVGLCHTDISMRDNEQGIT
jgi:D-arabinose 1-dehydrogenase-like Zn-dependent alcohol dehydrogenase